MVQSCTTDVDKVFKTQEKTAVTTVEVVFVVQYHRQTLYNSRISTIK